MTKKLKINTPHLFSFDECLFFLNRNYDECLYQIIDRTLYRVIKVNERLIPFSLSEKDGKLLIETHSTCSAKESKFIINFVEKWLDLDRDIRPFYELLNDTSKLTHFNKDYNGLRLIGIPDLFEAMCWSIIGQQINLTFAYKLKRRLVETYGESIIWKGIKLYHFPTPKVLSNLDEEFLKTQQFSRSKIQYLKNVALAFSEEGLSKQLLEDLPDFESRQNQLTKIKGIGVWSANYALMKTLHQPEAIPFGDTGLTQALFNHEIIEDRKDEKAILKFFKSVKGWEAYTVFYLWRSLSD